MPTEFHEPPPVPSSRRLEKWPSQQVDDTERWQRDQARQYREQGHILDPRDLATSKPFDAVARLRTRRQEATASQQQDGRRLHDHDRSLYGQLAIGARDRQGQGTRWSNPWPLVPCGWGRGLRPSLYSGQAVADPILRKLLWSRDSRERHARAAASVIAASLAGVGFVGMVLAGSDVGQALRAMGVFFLGTVAVAALVVYVCRQES